MSRTRRKFADKIQRLIDSVGDGDPSGGDNAIDCDRDYYILMGYRDNANRHVVPAIGKIPGRDLTALDVQHFYNRLQMESGLSAETDSIP